MKKKSFNFKHYGWVVLIMGTFAIFGALGLARFGYSVILPNMQAGLGMDNAQTGLLATMGLVGYLALAIIGGALASRYGIRIVASAGLALAGSGIAVGSSMGLIITGFVVPKIISVYGEKAWQISWLVFGSITLLLAVGSFIIIRNSPDEMGLEPIDDDEAIQTASPNDN